MAAIWHDTVWPSFLAAGPQYSFLDLAEVHEVAPATYAQARFALQAREMRLGAAWYRANAERAWHLWQLKKPWWLA